MTFRRMRDGFPSVEDVRPLRNVKSILREHGWWGLGARATKSLGGRVS
jgi:hypothetical protein